MNYTKRRLVALLNLEFNFGILCGLCQTIFTNVLGMKRASAKIFPKFLSFEQKQLRMDIAVEILTEDYDEKKAFCYD